MATNLQPGQRCTLLVHVVGAPHEFNPDHDRTWGRHEAARCSYVEAPAMKPGQRCTRPNDHPETWHRFSAKASELWTRGQLDRKIGRCPYVEPAPAVPAPVCDVCKGEGKVLAFYNRGPGDPPGNMRVVCGQCRGTGHPSPKGERACDFRYNGERCQCLGPHNMHLGGTGIGAWTYPAAGWFGPPLGVVASGSAGQEDEGPKGERAAGVADSPGGVDGKHCGCTDIAETCPAWPLADGASLCGCWCHAASWSGSAGQEGVFAGQGKVQNPLPQDTAVVPGTAREAAHGTCSQLFGTLPGRCTDEDEPDDIHGMGCDVLTNALAARDTSIRAAALEEAADALFAHAEKLYSFMEKQALNTERRVSLSRRASEWYEAETCIRALAYRAAPREGE